MPYRSHRGMGPADPGGHRHSGSPGGSHGARIHGPDLSVVPETAAAPGPSERSGRGSATLRSQSGGLDRDPAGRGAAACKDHPMVSANVPSVETERWGHRPGRSIRLPGRPDRKWTRRWSASVAARWSTPMKRVGGRTGKTATSGLSALPRSGSSCAGGGVVVDEVLGESFEGILVSDFYVAYHHYPGLKQRCWAHPRSGSGAGSAAGHSRAEGLVPRRRRAGPVGIGSATALRQRPGMGGGRGTPSVPRTVGTGRPVAGAVPAFPGRPVGSASQALPAD